MLKVRESCKRFVRIKSLTACRGPADNRGGDIQTHALTLTWSLTELWLCRFLKVNLLGGIYKLVWRVWIRDLNSDSWDFKLFYIFNRSWVKQFGLGIKIDTSFFFFFNYYGVFFRLDTMFGPWSIISMWIHLMCLNMEATNLFLCPSNSNVWLFHAGKLSPLHISCHCWQPGCQMWWSWLDFRVMITDTFNSG